MACFILKNVFLKFILSFVCNVRDKINLKHNYNLSCVKNLNTTVTT